jgi:hypothetical protein
MVAVAAHRLLLFASKLAELKLELSRKGHSYA